MHISSQKYNNGTTIFSATLVPDQEYCYLSSMNITSVDNQSCKAIAQIKSDASNDLKVNSYAEGAYTILTPADRSYQIILTTLGDNGCTINETRMIWPGR